MKKLIYLHGYNSSPQSYKAQATLGYIRRYHPDVECFIPQLSASPAQVQQQIHLLLDQSPSDNHHLSTFMIGSSLGGFYANYWAEQLGCKSVMINPTVHPYRLLKDYLGPQKNDVTGEEYTLTERHIEELEGLRVDSMAASEQRMVLLQSADETLDFLEASGFYSGCKLVVENGGDHTFIGYDRWLPAIAEFLNLSA